MPNALTGGLGRAKYALILLADLEDHDGWQNHGPLQKQIEENATSATPNRVDRCEQPRHFQVGLKT